MTAAAVPDSDVAYMEYLPIIKAFKATLTPAPTPVLGGTFRGGMLWELGHGRYVAILLPPAWRANKAMGEYFGRFFDGDWAELRRESFGAIQAVYLVPPWAT